MPRNNVTVEGQKKVEHSQYSFPKRRYAAITLLAIIIIGLALASLIHYGLKHNFSSACFIAAAAVTPFALGTGGFSIYRLLTSVKTLKHREEKPESGNRLKDDLNPLPQTPPQAKVSKADDVQPPVPLDEKKTSQQRLSDLEDSPRSLGDDDEPASLKTKTPQRERLHSKDFDDTYPHLVSDHESQSEEEKKQPSSTPQRSYQPTITPSSPSPTVHSSSSSSSSSATLSLQESFIPEDIKDRPAVGTVDTSTCPTPNPRTIYAYTDPYTRRLTEVKKGEDGSFTDRKWGTLEFEQKRYLEEMGSSLPSYTSALQKKLAILAQENALRSPSQGNQSNPTKTPSLPPASRTSLLEPHTMPLSEDVMGDLDDDRRLASAQATRNEDKSTPSLLNQATNVPTVSSNSLGIRRNLRIPEHILQEFSTVCSRAPQAYPELAQLKPDHGYRQGDPDDRYGARNIFTPSVCAGGWKPGAVVVSSSIVPQERVRYNLTHKKHDSQAVKDFPGETTIRKGEAVENTFPVPIAVVHLTGDPRYRGEHTVDHYDRKASNAAQRPVLTRKVVMSGMIKPDFEYVGGEKGEAMGWALAPETKEVSAAGSPANVEFPILSEEDRRDDTKVAAYNLKIKQRMIYQLTASGTLPSIKAIEKEVLSIEQAIDMITQAITTPDFDFSHLQGVFVKINKGRLPPKNISKVAFALSHDPKNTGHEYIISLEALFSVYVHQLRNELSTLEAVLPQGYVLTLDPAAIFAKSFDPTLCNRLEILAFKFFGARAFKNLKMIGFNDFADKKALDLLQRIFAGTDIQVHSKAHIMEVDKKFNLINVDSQWALVLHFNGDGFGNNLMHEKRHSSLEGLYGTESDLACVLDPERLATLSDEHFLML